MNDIFKKLLRLAAIFIFLYMHPVFAMEVAITVDDLPANGKLASFDTHLSIAKTMLAIFKKHHIRAYGFINGCKLNEISNGFDILQEWVKAGQLLGNHTYNHMDLAKTDHQEFTNNISRNEPILAQFMFNKNDHYFRYPFLSEGNTQEKRDLVRQFLFKNRYKIAPVTIDFFEYEWNDAYVRCLKKDDKHAIAWLKKSYIEQANNALIISHVLSMMLFNRDIKNVLLIHINSFTTEMLDDLLTNYENNNVTFITLSDALEDKVYQINPDIVRERAYTFLNQIRLSKGLNNPTIVKKLYNSLPEDRLNQICR